MKKLTLFGSSALTAALLSALPMQAFADGNTSPMNAEIEIGGQMPVGSFYDSTGIGLGGSLRYEYNFIPSLAASVRVGYLYSLKKNSKDYSQVPALVGLKYNLPPSVPIFFTGELGYYYVDKMVSGGSSYNYNKFGYVLGTGYPIGPCDVRVNWNVWDAAHTADASDIGITVGWNFWTI